MIEFLEANMMYLQYLVPPLVGAFIGYLTNKIAIRMLFRPLKPWYLFGLKVPMTPGVIPSKRHRLAVNIGKMVGGHLLTSKEIKKALRRESFQTHLGALIRERVGAVLKKDLPPLPNIVPKKYGNYFAVGMKTVAYQTKQQIHAYIASRDFENRISGLIEESIDQFLEKDLDTLINREDRDRLYRQLKKHVTSLLRSQEVEQWLEDFLYAQLNRVVKSEKSLDELLPEELRDALVLAIEEKIPEFIEKLADVLQDTAVQKKIVEAISSGIESFAQTLGPMGTMLQNFLNAETIEKAIGDYLRNNKEEIAAMLSDKDVQQKLCNEIIERIQHYMKVPLSSIITRKMHLDSRKICKATSEKIAVVLQQESVAGTLTALLADTFEEHLQRSGGELGHVASSFMGEKSIGSFKAWGRAEAIALCRSQKGKQFVDAGVDRLMMALLQKPVGKLSHFLPAGVREGLYNSIRRISTAMLAAEVPGLVSSLNIEHIVAEKVDSLDLVRLEGLLLSIMEEQFKYINLFGALLGFLIGLINVVVLYIL